MSSSNSPLLALDLAPWRGLQSRVLLVLSGLLMVAVLQQIGLILIPKWVMVTLSMGVLIGLGLMLWADGYWQASRSLRRLIWSQQGDWLLQFADGRMLEAQLSVHSWVTAWLWCLRFEAPNEYVAPVLVWRSQLSRQTWQLWRTRLHLEGRTKLHAAPRPL